MQRRKFLKNGLIASSLPLIANCNTKELVHKRTMVSFTKPARLKENDKIGIVAPAYMITEEQLQDGVNSITEMGMQPVYNQNVLRRNGYLSGTDQERAEEVNKMFANPEIKGIVCGRGGYGCTRMLNYVDYDMIAQNPKVLLGFSDITALANAINERTGLVTFHGPVGTTLDHEYSREKVIELLMYAKDDYFLDNTIIDTYKEDPEFIKYTINAGVARGKLCGGNLTLVSAMMGTPYQIDTRDKILILEDVGEEPYRIDRMLTQLLSGGVLDQVAGIAIGACNGCDLDDETTAPNSFSLSDVLKDRLSGLNIPVGYGFNFGHHRMNAVLPIGMEAEIDTRDFTIKLFDSAVS